MRIYKFALPHYANFIEKADDLKTPAFYTHDRGYKMCLGVVAHKTVMTNKNVISLCLYSLPGEYDAELSWPVHCNFQLEIINKGANLVFNIFLQQYITLNSPDLKDFVEDDILVFRVISTAVEWEDEDPLGPFRVPTKEDNLSLGLVENSVECPAISVLMSNYQKLSDASLTWKGPVIYTHYQGYQIYFMVEWITAGDGLKYILISLYRMRGRFDHLLEWPVRYDVMLKIVNKQGGGNLVFSTGDKVWNETISA